MPVIKITGLEVGRKHRYFLALQNLFYHFIIFPKKNELKLKKSSIFSFFVVARNAAGTSLPSSIINLNVSKEAWSGDHSNGVKRMICEMIMMMMVDYHHDQVVSSNRNHGIPK